MKFIFESNNLNETTNNIDYDLMEFLYDKYDVLGDITVEDIRDEYDKSMDNETFTATKNYLIDYFNK